MNSSDHHPRAFATGASIGTGRTRSSDIRKLRKVLDTLDYLQSPPKVSLTYTPTVAAVVERFQHDFGLKRDGVIAPDGPTEQALNFAVEAAHAGGPAALNRARSAFVQLHDKGFRFTRDRADFGALGVWRDPAGNKVPPHKIPGTFGDFAPGREMADAGVSRTPLGSSDRNAHPATGVAGPRPINSRRSASPSPPSQNADPAPKPAGNKGKAGTATQLHPRDMQLRDVENPDNLERFFRHHYVDEWRREGKIQASKNMKHYLDGSGKPMRFTRDEARAFKPIEELENKVRRHFEQGEFVGKTQRNPNHYNERIRNLKDGESLSHSDHNDAEIKSEDTILQYLGKETDFALAFGRTKLRGDAKFTATRKGDTIHIEGSITHNWKDTYDFEKGQVAAGGAHRLEKEKGAMPFDMGATWKQNFSGTVEINNGVLSNPQITWTDIDSEE